MIVKKFEEQARQAPDNVALHFEEASVTYAELNRYANRAAHVISYTLKQDGSPGRVGLLFERCFYMLAALLGTLKSGNAYVPLSPGYPEQRLSYMISHSGVSLILADADNMALAGKLAVKNKIIALDAGKLVNSGSVDNLGRTGSGEELMYILYTSGSTGRPKGVMQTQRNVLHFIDQYRKNLDITAKDHLTFFSSFSHDAAVMDIYTALLNGATIYPLDIREQNGIAFLPRWLEKKGITIWHSVPTLYRYFVNHLDSTPNLPALRFIVLGGEAVLKNDIDMYRKHFPQAVLYNLYGQTESSYNSGEFINADTPVNYITLGTPVEKTAIFVIDEDNAEVDEYEVGEIVVAGSHVSPGYWQDAESTKNSFSKDEEFGSLYFTGDSGRLLPDGRIEFMGRQDTQVKLRGFRIELGEIESRLLKHEDIKEAVVLAKEDPEKGKYLCGYIAAQSKDPVGANLVFARDQESTGANLRSARGTPGIEVAKIREFLSLTLPDYMIPNYFVTLDRLPLTQSGKIDRRALPEPEIGTGKQYTAPRNPVEKNLVDIWHTVLGVEKEKIGIDADFFELGGHSLRGTTMLAKVHRVFNVRIPVAKIFQIATIRGLAAYIAEAVEDKYIPIEPAAPRNYYPASSLQERLFILSRIEGIDTAYNMRSVMQVEGKLDFPRLEKTFAALIERHESLRTSFELNDDKLVQIVHDTVDFEIEYFDITGSPEAAANTERIIKEFIRPFDLDEAPLMRAGLIKIEEEKYVLLRDTHHIISDGTSQVIFLRELLDLYRGKQLPELTIQYKDFVEWQRGEQQQARLKKQEDYWLQLFKEGIPGLENFTDFPRPDVQSFAGDLITMQFDEELTRKLNRLVRESGATLYMVLLTVYNILLYKYTGQQDIVIGTPVAGREHPVLENIIGLFINVLVMRNYPGKDKSLSQFLEEVKTNTTAAYENQGYPFGDLVEKLGVKNDISRNPIYDVELIVQNIDFPSLKIKEISFSAYPYEVNVSQVDAALYVMEIEEKIYFRLIYETNLFKRGTMERFLTHFKEIVSLIVQNQEIKLQDIEISHNLQRIKPDVYSEMAVDLEF